MKIYIRINELEISEKNKGEMAGKFQKMSAYFQGKQR